MGAKNTMGTFSLPVGDIRPQNIFISHDRRVKVGTTTSFPYEKTSFAKLTD
jgi:V8-like Glu-specific endopeptidase